MIVDSAAEAPNPLLNPGLRAVVNAETQYHTINTSIAHFSVSDLARLEAWAQEPHLSLAIVADREDWVLPSMTGSLEVDLRVASFRDRVKAAPCRGRWHVL